MSQLKLILKKMPCRSQSLYKEVPDNLLMRKFIKNVFNTARSIIKFQYIDFRVEQQYIIIFLEFCLYIQKLWSQIFALSFIVDISIYKNVLNFRIYVCFFYPNSFNYITFCSNVNNSFQMFSVFIHLLKTRNEFRS